MMRRANAGPDWYQARVRTNWSLTDRLEAGTGGPPLDGRATTTVVCADLVAPGHIRSFEQFLRHLLGVPDDSAPGTDGVALRIEPPGKKNVLHVDAPLPLAPAVRGAVVRALQMAGITRVELRPVGPPADDASPDAAGAA
jgi:hypothetical protein